MTRSAENPSLHTYADLTTDVVRSVGLSAGLAAVGVAPAEVLEPARTLLTLRKAKGLAGAMQFTYRNPERSTAPGLVVEGARSLIAGAYRYPSAVPSAADPEQGGAVTGRVARYAVEDYYADLRKALSEIAEVVTGFGYQARVIADQNALVDRNVAWSAGIGSYGKNANLMLPKVGSWFVLGAVVTDAPLASTGPPVPDQCGPCMRCIDECPTGAIVAQGVVDATRCIAWLVQSDGPLPVEFRANIGDRLYGCDDCQEVCPPNRTPLPSEPANRTKEQPGQHDTVNHLDTGQVDAGQVDVLWLLDAADDDILAKHGRWYIARRDVDNIRRTALVVLGNVAKPAEADSNQKIGQALRKYLAHPNPVLRGHAIWAARRLGVASVLPSSHSEKDPTVAAEFSSEVEPRFQASDWDGVQ